MIEQIKKVAEQKGFALYERPFELNIWGKRSGSTTPNSFDDELHVFTNIARTGDAQWAYFVFRCTTDPGTYWLKNPMNSEGTAILCPGQYAGAYQLGLHKGYRALVQTGAMVKVTRDGNHDAVLNFGSGKVFTGFFRVDIHRGNKEGITQSVDKNSAGCQVFQSEPDFEFFLQLCELHAFFYGNKFSYTLVVDDLGQVADLQKLPIEKAQVAFALGGSYLIDK